MGSNSLSRLVPGFGLRQGSLTVYLSEQPVPIRARLGGFFLSKGGLGNNIWVVVNKTAKGLVTEGHKNKETEIQVWVPRSTSTDEVRDEVSVLV